MSNTQLDMIRDQVIDMLTGAGLYRETCLTPEDSEEHKLLDEEIVELSDLLIATIEDFGIVDYKLKFRPIDTATEYGTITPEENKKESVIL